MRSALLALALLAASSWLSADAQTANGYNPQPAPAISLDTIVRGPAAYRGLSVAANASTPLMDANPARRGFTVQNQTTGNCGIKIGGATATLDQVSLRIAPGALYETPSHHVSTGAVAVICASAGGVYATEF